MVYIIIITDSATIVVMDRNDLKIKLISNFSFWKWYSIAEEINASPKRFM